MYDFSFLTCYRYLSFFISLGCAVCSFPTWPSPWEGLPESRSPRHDGRADSVSGFRRRPRGWATSGTRSRNPNGATRAIASGRAAGNGWGKRGLTARGGETARRHAGSDGRGLQPARRQGVRRADEGRQAGRLDARVPVKGSREGRPKPPTKASKCRPPERRTQPTACF